MTTNATALYPAHKIMSKYVDVYNSIVSTVANPDAINKYLEGLFKEREDAKSTEALIVVLEKLVYAKALLQGLGIDDTDTRSEMAMIYNAVKGAEAYPSATYGTIPYVSAVSDKLADGIRWYANLSCKEKFVSCKGADGAETFRNLIAAYTYKVVKEKVVFERSSGMHYLVLAEEEKPFSLEWIAAQAREYGGVGTTPNWADVVEALVIVYYRSNYNAIFGRECKGLTFAVSEMAKIKAEKVEKPSKTAISKLLNEALLDLGEVNGKALKALNHHAEILIRSSLTNVRASKYAWASASVKEAYENIFKIFSNILSKRIDLECRSVIIEA